jgi:hypothetical protein
MSMNLRHTAALALVGWYLMMPPVREPKHDEPYVDDRASYSEWAALIWFSDQAQCEQNRDDRIQVIEHDSVKFPNIDVWAEQLLELDCIATDDPRLKSN